MEIRRPPSPPLSFLDLRGLTFRVAFFFCPCYNNTIKEGRKKTVAKNSYGRVKNKVDNFFFSLLETVGYYRTNTKIYHRAKLMNRLYSKGPKPTAVEIFSFLRIAAERQGYDFVQEGFISLAEYFDQK